jgi:hypothetical protein
MIKKLPIGEVNIKEIVDHLAFEEEDLQTAALEQAKLYMAAATYRVKQMRHRQEAEMHLDNLRVDYGLKLRMKYKGQKGTTERFINDMIERVPEIRTAVSEVAKAKRFEEWSKLLLDAFEHRRSSLKILSQFIFMQDTFTGKFETGKLKARRAALRGQLAEQEEV